VIDTADWAENMCIKKLNAEHKTANILTMDYGKGSLFVVAEFEKLINYLDKIIANGINVVITAHAAMRKQEQPDEMGAYDRWELKLQSKQVKSMIKEWADMVLFANYKTYVIEDDKTKSKKAQGGKRVMYTSHHPCWDAKNRYGLPDCVDFSYDEIAPIVAVFKEPTAKIKGIKVEVEEKKEEKPKKELSKEHKELKELMMRDGISKERLEYAVATKRTGSDDFVSFSFEDYEPEFIQKSLIDKWAGFCKYAKKFTKEEIEKGFVPFN
jgi:protein-arginine kinase activator protein McsA